MDRKLIVSLSLAAGVALSAGGCKRSSSGADSSSITVAGSNSMLPFSEAWAEEYAKKNPGRKVSVQGGGSTAGVKAALSGTADIGDCSRDLKPDETGLVATIVARDGISVVVSRSNPVSNLTMAQVKAVFTGQVKSWKDLGGDDHAMTVITREEGSGARGAFEELALEKKPVFAGAIVVNSTGGIREMVKNDPYAIAFGTMGQMNDEVKSLKIDGAEATAANAAAGTYKLVHPFLMLTKGAPSPAAQHFIDFVLSPDGQALAKKEGLIAAR